MKPKKYVVSLSGGKDSTAMLLRLIAEKRPIDYIIFCDTGLEFPQMYEHIDKLERYINRPIIRLKAEHDFEYYFFLYHPKRKNPELEKYDGMSWGGPRNRWCTAMLKTRVLSNYFKDLKKDFEIVEYIGILSNIFWDMNSIDSKIETRTETKETTSTDENGEEVVTTEEVTIKVLIITINGKNADETAADYSFNKKQKEYLAELMDESNDKLWASIIFGFSGSNSDIDIGSLDFGNETVSDIQRKLVAVATNSSSYGISAKSGYCQAWVADVYQAVLGSRSSAHCALCAADMWAVSNDWSKIQVGATVYGYASNPYGHVGIYIGNGKVIHNLSGTVKIQSLESWVKDFNGFAWGWENGKI